VATGDLNQQLSSSGGQKIAGFVIVKAVRLEAAARAGQIVIDAATFDSLPAEFQGLYGLGEKAAGKEGEEAIDARRCTAVPLEGSDARPTEKAVME
jgi:class 3 adenylate cyclase